jgi:Pla-1/cef family extracellular lipase
MNKLAISIAITSVLGLSACDDTTLEDVQQESTELQLENAETAAENAASRLRVVWDPANSNVSVPTDLLFSGTSDFTLEMPGETASKDAGEDVDFTNVSNVIGALDGWGTQNPFVVSLEGDDESVAIDATTINGTSVALYQVVSYPDFRDEECSDTTKATLLCKAESQLVYGIDYIATASGNNIAVIPLKPFTAQTSYALTLTKAIKDTNGRDLMPSDTYGSVEQDITTTPLVLPSLSDDELNETQAGIRTLQTLINSFETVLANDLGADKDEIVYTQIFTTQSAGVAGTDPLQVTKQLNAQVFAATAAASSTAVVTSITTQGYNVAQGLGLTSPSLAYSLYSSSDVYTTTIEVPYYLETPETGDPLTGRWEAACDSGIVLALATDEQKAAAAANAGDNNATCTAIGLADLGLDTQRHLTKYNPLPKTKSTETVNVQVTLPNVAAANTFRALISAGQYPDIEKDDAGWPVVIIQHGITSKKEEMLATTAWLSVNGYATVAIDHPLHGDRGFTVLDTDGEISAVINTSSSVEGGAATTYLNLSSLLSARDNLRQSTADILKLRLALNALYDGATPAVDPENVYFMGHSLGGIVGVNAVAVANTPTGNTSLDALYKIKAAVFANPGSSIANFLVESGSFGPLVKASVVYGLGNELTDSLQANIDDLITVVGTNLARGVDASSYCSAVYASVLASETPAQTDALICAFDEFMNTATIAEQTAVASAVSQFAFAAQAALEAGDPSNYTQLLKTLNTPVLVYEVAGDGTDDNLPDQTIPNSISTDPFKGIAGTTGLANQLALSEVTETVTSETDTTSGIVRFTSGSHSTFANPSDAADTGGTATVHTEMQTIMYKFFNSDGKTIELTPGKCVVKDVVDESCTAAE